MEKRIVGFLLAFLLTVSNCRFGVFACALPFHPIASEDTIYAGSEEKPNQKIESILERQEGITPIAKEENAKKVETKSKTQMNQAIQAIVERDMKSLMLQENSLTVEERKSLEERVRQQAFKEYHSMLLMGYPTTSYPVTEDVFFDFEERNLDNLISYIQKNLLPDFSIKEYDSHIDEYYQYDYQGTIEFKHFFKGFRTGHFIMAYVRDGKIVEIVMNEKPHDLVFPEIINEISEAEVVKLALEDAELTPDQVDWQKVSKWFDIHTGMLYYCVLTADFGPGYSHSFCYDLN